jgi:hypothetical protein
LELPFECAIGHPAPTLQHGQGLIHNFLEGHGRPSISLALPLTERRTLQPRDHLAKAPRVYQEHGRRVQRRGRRVSGSTQPGSGRLGNSLVRRVPSGA